MTARAIAVTLSDLSDASLYLLVVLLVAPAAYWLIQRGRGR